jgi:hypothetical protein
VPDTDERVVLEKHSPWRTVGPALVARVVAGLALLMGMGLIAVPMARITAAEEAVRPASVLLDLLAGFLLVGLTLAFYVTDRTRLLLAVGAVLWAVAGGHLALSHSIGPLDLAAAALGLLSGLCGGIGHRTKHG